MFTIQTIDCREINRPGRTSSNRYRPALEEGNETHQHQQCSAWRYPLHGSTGKDKQIDPLQHGGIVSHAMICVQHGSFIDSTADGVQARNLQRELFEVTSRFSISA